MFLAYQPRLIDEPGMTQNIRRPSETSLYIFHAEHGVCVQDVSDTQTSAHLTDDLFCRSARSRNAGLAHHHRRIN